MRQPGSRERGAATVFVLAVAAMVLAAGAVGSAVAGVVLLRHGAARAADAAALGAAMRVAAGRDAACARAAEVAGANGAGLLACAVHDAVVTVTVRSTASGWWAWLPAVRLDARAGPVETYREQPASLDRAS